MSMINLTLSFALLGFVNVLFANNNYHEFSQNCMGARFRIILDHDNYELCRAAADQAFSECNRLNEIFSDYSAESEVSRLSNSPITDKFLKVSDELFEVLTFSKQLAEKTNGAFDPTMGRVSRLWRIARYRKILPSDKALGIAMKNSGHKHLGLDANFCGINLKKPEVILDLGGIAKGYAADKMLNKIKQAGIHRVLIDAGGDLVLGKAPRGKSGWTVEIGGRANFLLPTLNLQNCAIATSGDSEQFVEIEGVRYSHIFNPRTGYGLQDLSQVSVIAKNGMIADSYATTALIIGCERTKEILNTQKTPINAYFFEDDSLNPKISIIKNEYFSLDKIYEYPKVK